MIRLRQIFKVWEASPPPPKLRTFQEKNPFEDAAEALRQEIDAFLEFDMDGGRVRHRTHIYLCRLSSTEQNRLKILLEDEGRNSRQFMELMLLTFPDDGSFVTMVRYPKR